MAVQSRPLAVAPRPVWYAGMVRRWLGQMTVMVMLIMLPTAFGRAEQWWNRLVVGEHPTTVVTARVGHGDEAARPTTFIALNANRQVIVLELPGGDTEKMQRLVGPYLVGVDEDRTPVELDVSDWTGDGKADLALLIKGEVIRYRNTGTTFVRP